MVRRHPKGLTYAQIGEMLGGLSRERVRQIEARALQKLRRLAKRDRSIEAVLVAVLEREEPLSPWEEMHTRG